MLFVDKQSMWLCKMKFLHENWDEANNLTSSNVHDIIEELPLKILHRNLLHTLRPLWSYSEATCFTVAKTHAYVPAFRFCNFLYQEFNTHTLSTCTYIQAEGCGNHTMSKWKTSQCITTFFEKRSIQGMQDTHSKLFSQQNKTLVCIRINFLISNADIWTQAESDTSKGNQLRYN